jgi:hypothetical protein
MKTAQEIQTIAYEAVRDVIKRERNSRISKVEFRACSPVGLYIDASNEWIGPFHKLPPLSEIEKAQAAVRERVEVGVMFLSVFIKQNGALISEVEVDVTTGELEYW